MPECTNCGSFVTSNFARVLGNNEGVVERCVECLNGEDSGGTDVGGVWRLRTRVPGSGGGT